MSERQYKSSNDFVQKIFESDVSGEPQHNQR